MKERIITALLLTLTVAVFFVMQFVHAITFDFLVAGLCVITAIEFNNMLVKMGKPTYTSLVVAMPLVIFAVILISNIWNWSALIIFLIVISLIALLYFGSMIFNILLSKKELNEDKFRQGTNMTVKQFAVFKSNNTFLAFIYPNLLIFFLYFINHIDTLGFAKITENYAGDNIAFFGLILVFAVTVFTDTFAFFTGRTLKGPKVMPKVSPNKTWSGVIGGTLGGMIAAISVYFIFNAIYPTAFVNVFWWQLLIIGFVCSIVSQIGDFFESYLKRKANIKDTSNILPGHGGVLDRVDGLSFNIPVMFICLLILL